MSVQADAAPAKPSLRWSVWIPVCVLFGWLQMLLAGYELGVGNQSIQVPFLLRLHDASLFARDAMVNATLDQYPTLFFRGLAYALDFVSLPTLYWILHLLTSAGVFFAVVALAHAMFRSTGAALTAVLVLLAGHHHALAEQTLYSTGFTHTWAVFPLTIAALALFYADQPLAAFAVAGISFNIHALEAGQLALALTLAGVFTLPMRRVAGLLAMFLVLAAPTIVHMLLHRQAFDAQWLQLMHVRSGHHSFPSTWWSAGQPDVPQFLMILALAGLAMTLGPGPHLRKTFLLTGGVALMFVAGILFTELWPSALVIRAQLFRSSRFLIIIALAYIAAGCVRARGFELVGAALIIACLAVPPWLVLLPVTLLVAMLLALAKRRLLWQQAALAGTALLVTLAAWRTIDFVPVGIAWNFHRPAPGNDPAWLDVQRWAREHTPTDAVFLTPAQMSGFRVHSERAVVGEWRDGTQLYFSAAFAKPWWERMNALQPGMQIAPDGKRLLVQGRSLSQLNDTQLIMLATNFSATYIVVAAEPAHKLTALYRNERWAVYLPALAPIPVVTTNPWAEQQRFLAEVAWPNIEKHRKSDVRLQIVDATGRPLYDAPYRVTQTASAFGFNWRVIGVPPDGQRRSEALDQALTPGPPVEFSSLSASLKPAQTNLLATNVLDLVTRYADRVAFWQVTDQGVFINQASNLVALLREKFPTIKLGISDAPRLDRLDTVRGLDDVRRLKGLDFVAIHGRQPWGVWADARTLYELFDAFAKEGLRIHITQFDAPSEGWIEGPVRRGEQWTPALRTEYARLFYTVAYSHPAVEMIAGTPPVEWRTETNGTVALDGRLAFRGFHGDYELEVKTAAGKAVTTAFTVVPGTNSYRFQLDANGTGLSRAP